jgi:tetratricopeptide (TPR) repeat protein
LVAHPASSAPGSASFTTAGVSVSHGDGGGLGSAGAAARTRALAELDERIASGGSGVVLARVERSIEGAILTHVARRVRASGRSPLVARAHDGAPLWREVASRLSQGQVDCDPARCAEQIMGAALLRRVVVVAPLPAVGTWDRAVAAQLASSGSGALIIFVADESDTASDIRADRFDIAGHLDAEDKQRWWSAVAEEAHAIIASDDLATLETWWASVKRRPRCDDATDAPLPEAARALFTALALAGRAWSLNALGALGAGDEAASLLVHAGAAQTDRGFLGIARAWDERARQAADAASSAERLAVARALGGTDPEPWVFARVAELLARECAAGSTASLDDADAAHAKAVSLAQDPIARREIVSRWMRAVDGLPREAQLELRVRAAQRALAAGEADEGNRWAQSAAVIAHGDARVTLLLGRASAALGDLVAAKVALESARSAVTGTAPEAGETRALIAVELAEVAYLTGDLATSSREAHVALVAAADPSTRLKARNTLGKILLAEAKWEEADAHFAEDIMIASAQRDATAELRARLNRGIALMSKGLIDEARSVFEAVLEEGERVGETRAMAYAHSNLGVVAIRRHEYAKALVHWEHTIKLLQHMRDRMAAARTLANLADLRHHLGLYDHAEHAITFGRRALGAGMPAGRALHFGMVAARIALSRGHTIDARREIGSAIAEGESAGNPEALGDASRSRTAISSAPRRRWRARRSSRRRTRPSRRSAYLPRCSSALPATRTSRTRLAR